MTTAPSPAPVLAPSVPTCEPGPSGPPRSRWPWPVQCLVSVLLLAVALAVPSLLNLIPALSALGSDDAPLGSAVAYGVVLQVLVLVVAVAAVALVARLDGRRRLRDLGWRWDRRSLPALAVGVLISVVVMVAIGVPLTTAGLLRPDDPGIAGEPLWAVLVIGIVRALVLQAIPEELIFRGYLLTSVRLRPHWAVLVSGLTFGSLHLASSGGQQGWGERVMYVTMATGFGFAAGALMLTTRSLWAAVGIHGGLHLTLLAVGLLPRTGTGVTVEDGPALWVLTGLAWTLVAVALMVRLHRSSRSARPADVGQDPMSSRDRPGR